MNMSYIQLPSTVVWRTINGARVAIDPKSGMAVAGAGGNLPGSAGDWRIKAGRLGDAIADKQAELRAMMAVGSGEVRGSGFSGRADFVGDAGRVAEKSRVRALTGADREQARLERELQQLVKLQQLAIKRYQDIERG